MTQPPDLCMCKDRAATECPGEWEPGCDLGNNPDYARPAPRTAAPAEPVAQVVAVFPPGPDGNQVDWLGGREQKAGTLLYTAPPLPAVTDEMVTAYLKANDEYWRKVDEIAPPVGVWRNGTPREATRESLRAALATPAAPTADPSQIGGAGLVHPAVPGDERAAFEAWWFTHPLRNDEVTPADVRAAWLARSRLSAPAEPKT